MIPTRPDRSRATTPTAESPSRGNLVALAVCLGLAWGFAEVVVVAIQRFLLQRPVWLGEQLIWMAPLAAGAIATVVGVAAVVIVWPLSRRFATLTALWGVSFTACWSLVIVAAPGLKEYARVLLAAGIGTQLTLLARARLAARPQRVRRAATGLAFLAAGFWILVQPGAEVLERIRVARLPAPAARLPNVLLIVFDTERAQSLSLHGNPRATSPVLERLAERGVHFTRAFSTSSWTLPSHASLFTGKEAHELSAAWLTRLDDSYPTLAERLADAGYLTAGFVANTYYCGRDFGVSRGFLHYDDYVASPEELLVSLGLLRRTLNSWAFRRATRFGHVLTRKRAADVNLAFLEWLNRRGNRERPFFAFLNYHDPHEPYAPPPPYDAMFGRPLGYWQAAHKHRDAAWPDLRRFAMAAEGIQRHLDAYEGAITYADAQLGALVDALAQQGILEHTLLVVTSDHGEQFREHDRVSDGRPLFTHGNSLHAQVLWVPLVMVYPLQIPEGLEVDTPVSLRDIPATIAALTGALEAESFPGQSLAAFWESESLATPSLPVATVVAYDQQREPEGWISSVVLGDFHFIRYQSGEIELYNHRDDPAEARELSGELATTAEGTALIDSLARVLDQAVSGWSWPRTAR